MDALSSSPTKPRQSSAAHFDFSSRILRLRKDFLGTSTLFFIFFFILSSFSAGVSRPTVAWEEAATSRIKATTVYRKAEAARVEAVTAHKETVVAYTTAASSDAAPVAAPTGAVTGYVVPAQPEQRLHQFPWRLH